MIRSLELSGFSSRSSYGGMDVTFALSQETTATIGEDCGNFRNNCERDFFGRFTADVESGGREQISDSGVEIVRSIFAQPRQQLSMTFSGPEQSNVLELERQKPIKREEIATKIVSHDYRGSLRVRTKVFGQFCRMAEPFDHPAEISSKLSDRLDLGSGAEE